MWKLRSQRERNAITIAYLCKTITINQLAMILACPKQEAVERIDAWVITAYEEAMAIVSERTSPWAGEKRLYDEAIAIKHHVGTMASASDGRSKAGRRLWRIHDRLNSRAIRREYALDRARDKVKGANDRKT